MTAPSRVGTSTNNTGSGDPVTFSHTTTSDTDLLTVSFGITANETVVGVTFDGNALTLIHATTPSGNNRDVYMLTYGIVSPGAKTATVSIDFGNSAAVNTICHNWTDVDTASVAAATNFIDDAVNNGGSSTAILSSGGTSGNTLYAIGGHFTTSSATWASAAFTEIGEYPGGVDMVDGEYTSPPAGTTITWTSADENAAILIEIVAAGAGPAGNPPAYTHHLKQMANN